MNPRSMSPKPRKRHRALELFVFPGAKINGKSRPVMVSSFMLITLLLTTINNPFSFQDQPKANASVSGDKVALYLSAPLVQGSGVLDAAKANFNSTNLSSVACPTSLEGIGSLTFKDGGAEVLAGNQASVCVIDPWTRADSPSGSAGMIYGGASSEASTPFIGGSGTSFMAIPYAGSLDRSITFNLSAAAKYVGFWWSGGNAGNVVSFYDSADNLVAEIQSSQVTQKLDLNATPNTVESIGATSYPIPRYYGNPVYYPNETTQPAGGTYASYANCCIFTYLNIYVEGSLNIRKVKFSGRGFEFDNLAISTVQQTPEQSMVKIVEKNSADLVWNPASSLLLSTQSATPTSATTTGNGGITYSVKSAGGTGCSVNSSTGALTYSAAGNCVVTATSAETSTTFGATKDVTFVISSQVVQAPGKPGNPTATVGNGSAVVSISPPTTGDAPTSYTVTSSPGGLSCEIIPSATSCEFTGLTNGTNYTFTAVARNDGGFSVASDPSANVRPLLPPATPGTPIVTAGNASATLSWEPSATGTAPITYSVETIPSGGTCVVASSGSGTTASCTGLTNGTEYQFRVTASNGPSSSATSGTSTAVTPVAPPQPAPVAPVAMPEPPQAEDVQLTGSDQSLRVSMAPAAPETVTKYRITLSPGGRSCELTATESFCEISGAKQGVEYKVLATASNAAGTSKSATLNKRVILTSSGWLRYTGKMSVANFVANSSELLPKHKVKIRKLNSGKPKALHMTCTGFAAGPAISERIFELAADRAKSVCQQMKAHSGATFSTSARVPGLRFEGANRKVLVRVYSELN